MNSYNNNKMELSATIAAFQYRERYVLGCNIANVGRLTRKAT